MRLQIRGRSAARFAVALAAVFFAAGAPSTPATVQEPVVRAFDVEPGGRLTVDADRGSIRVETADGDRVHVEVHRELRERGRRDAAEAREIIERMRLEFTHEDDDVEIRAEIDREDGWSGGDDWPVKVRFEFTVPRRYDVDLETAGGSVWIDDLEGEARASTAGGSLHFGHITGPVWGRTAGGSIELEGGDVDADVETAGGGIRIGEVAGRIDAHTAGGSIRIERAGGSVRAHTSGGSIAVEEVAGAVEAETSGGSVRATITRQPGADCRLATSGGSVIVRLAEGIAVDLDAESGSGGGVKIDLGQGFDLTVEQMDRREFRGKLNGGGPRLVLRTSGGSVHVQGV